MLDFGGALLGCMFICRECDCDGVRYALMALERAALCCVLCWSIVMNDEDWHEGDGTVAMTILVNGLTSQLAR